MRTCVTGAAGFIGSNLVDALLAAGHHVTGIDSFTDYYDPAQKRSNLESAGDSAQFRLVEGDVGTTDLDALLDGADVLFHLAAQAGVRLSWEQGFPTYVERNVLATQRLLESARRHRLRRVVYASSSSVYGNAEAYPTGEDALPRPYSPYGVTKLAGEHLCLAYSANWDLPTVSLRFFTVYGPRQRPDMALHRLIEAALDGTSFPLFGSGAQVRDFTDVGDVVRAVVAAATADLESGTVLNVSGGASTSMTELIEIVGDSVGCTIEINRQQAQPGDVDRTGASIERARRLLGWEPAVSLDDGVRCQVAWHRDRRQNP